MLRQLDSRHGDDLGMREVNGMCVWEKGERARDFWMNQVTVV